MAKTTMTSPLQPLLEAVNGQVASALGESGQGVAKCVAEWQHETARFMGQRMESDLDAMRRVASCQNFGDMLAVQQSWARQAAEDYAAEFRKSQELAGEMMRAAWGPMGGWIASTMKAAQ